MTPSIAEPPPHALASSTYRIFLAGSVVSWIGDWMDLVAINWAVYQLTDSPVALGVVNACRLVPVFALSIPAGVLADRMDRRWLLIVTQLGLAALTLVVAGLVAAESSLWLFATVITIRSAISAIGVPVRSALLSAVVPSQSLAAAVATQTAAMNLSRIIGPAIAGGLMALLPMHWVIVINGLSFFVVVASLLIIRLDSPKPRKKAGAMADLGEAVAYIRGNPLVRSLLVVAVAPMVFGFPYTALMPLFAQELFDTGAVGFGLLLSSAAVGALAGSLWLSVRAGAGPNGRLLIGSLLLFGAALMVMVQFRDFYAAVMALFFVGLAGQLYRTSSRIALQVEVPDELRGRILSIALMDRGFIPLGAVLFGAVAEYAGAVWAGVGMGLGCIITPLLILLFDRTLWRMRRA